MPTPTSPTHGTAFLVAVACGVAALAAGCGRPRTSLRRPLAGSVTVDGAAVFAGAVTFHPRAGHAGPAATTAIRAGRYAFTGTNGPTAGPHRAVVVFLADATEAKGFAPRHGKARPPAPEPPPVPAAEPAAESSEPAADAHSAVPEASPPGPPAEEATPPREEPRPAPAPPPPNMREFDVEVPATSPPRLDFTILRGASP